VAEQFAFQELARESGQEMTPMGLSAGGSAMDGSGQNGLPVRFRRTKDRGLGFPAWGQGDRPR